MRNSEQSRRDDPPAWGLVEGITTHHEIQFHLALDMDAVMTVLYNI
jgi:hypothetical protein